MMPGGIKVLILVIDRELNDEADTKVKVSMGYRYEEPSFQSSLEYLPHNLSF